MRKVSKFRQRGSWAGILVLALLLFRSYVPAGFMPADGIPFALQLCPAVTAGMPGHLHHHAGTHAQFELCPFGSVPGAGPISHHIDFESAGPAPTQRTLAFEAPRLIHRAERSHPPRGPPSLV
jgi:hypothetical protein